MDYRLVPTKRHLGVGYLVGTGTAFALIVLTRLFSSSIEDMDLLLAIATSAMLTAGLVYTGLWLFDGPLDDTSVWNVAQWGAFGLSVPTFFTILSITYLPINPSLRPSFFVSVIAAGGVVGSLVGTITQLNDKHEQLVELHDRNMLLQRVLRHNVRSSMSTIRGYADVLATNLEGNPEEIARSIRRKADGVIDLGETARTAAAIDEKPVRTPVDLVSVLGELLTAVEQYYPHATIERDLPDEAWVAADHLLELALWHLIENAIEHNPDPTPTVRVAVRPSSEGPVRLVIADDGPGLPEEMLGALDAGRESGLDHLEGLGVWLAKWLLESFDGEIEFDPNEPTGTVVRIALETAEPPPQSEPMPHVGVGDR